MTDFNTIREIQESLDSSPFSAFCGFRIEEVDKKDGRIVMSMPMRPEMERLAGSGQMHGGPIACLVDTATCYACMLVLGHGVPTINFRIDYLRPVIDTDLKAVASVRRAGRTVAVADVDIFNDSGKLIATGRGTFSASAG
ncbi:MAG: PaaI family thioesterase [Gammaproteobacteria bacterium]|nr:PaaI family thioesterase [Gammaproteobacteria bacterium]